MLSWTNKVCTKNIIVQFIAYLKLMRNNFKINRVAYYEINHMFNMIYQTLNYLWCMQLLCHLYVILCLIFFCNPASTKSFCGKICWQLIRLYLYGKGFMHTHHIRYLFE